MTDQSSLDELTRWRGAVVAAELITALAAGDAEAAENMFTQEANRGLLRELVGGLASAAVALAQTAAATHGDLTEADLYQLIAERSRIGLAGALEIQTITDPEGHR